MLLNKHLPDDICVFDLRRVSKAFSPRVHATARSYCYTLPSIAFSQHDDQTPMEEYRIPSERLDLANTTLQNYKGVRNFHNFTIDVQPTDQWAWRNMHHLECGNRIYENGIEFVVIRIRGQSFMMHQIRKMIGLTLAVVRGIEDSSIFERAFSTDPMNIPTAPGLGLVLDEVHYNRYDEFQKKKTDRESLVWDVAEKGIDAFNMKYIQPNIIRQEIEQKPLMNWIQELSEFNYEIPQEANDNNNNNHM